MIARVLERTGATVRAQGEKYKAVAQSVILYGSKIWVVTGEMLKVLTASHQSGGATDHGYDDETRGRRRVGVNSGR